MLLPVNQHVSITHQGCLPAGSPLLSVAAVPHAAPLDSWLRQVLALSMGSHAQRFSTPFPCNSGRFCFSLGPDCFCWLQLAWQRHSGAISRINSPLVKEHQQASCAHLFLALYCSMGKSGQMKRVLSCLSEEKIQPSNGDAVFLQCSPGNRMFLLPQGVPSPLNNLK